MDRIEKFGGVFKFKKCCPRAPFYIHVCDVCIPSCEPHFIHVYDVHPPSCFIHMCDVHPPSCEPRFIHVHDVHTPSCDPRFIHVHDVHTPYCGPRFIHVCDVHPPSCEPHFRHVCDVHDGFYIWRMYAIVEHLLSSEAFTYNFNRRTNCRALSKCLLFINNHSTPLRNGRESTQL